MALLADLPNFLDPAVIIALLTLTVLEIILGVDNCFQQITRISTTKGQDHWFVTRNGFRIILLFAITG